MSDHNKMTVLHHAPANNYPTKSGKFKQLFKAKLEPCYLQPGKYDNNPGPMSTYEDFKEAEWHDEDEEALNGDQVCR